MHVAIDARLVHYTRAGIGEYTLRLTHALAEAYPGDRFTLLQDFRDASPAVIADNVAIAKSRVPSHHRLEQYLLPLVVNGLKADVFHSPDFIPPLHARGRSVITIHDLAFLIYPHFLTKEAARYYGQIDRAVRRRRSDHRRVGKHQERPGAHVGRTARIKISVIYEGADPLYQPIDRAAGAPARSGARGICRRNSSCSSAPSSRARTSAACCVPIGGCATITS